MSLAIPESLQSPRVLGAVAAAASLVLLLRSTLAFEPPKPIATCPCARDAPPSEALTKFKAIYPEDYWPGTPAYFRSPFGNTRYCIIGEKGLKIVFIHGLSIPSIVWREVAPEMVKRGYQVLVYDLFGRGYSDAPDVPYSATLYTTQLALLLQHIRWDKARIVGLSMGGAIATHFAGEFPHLVDGQVVLVAPAGLVTLGGGSRIGLKTVRFLRALATYPLLGTLLSPLTAARRIEGVELLPEDAVERVVALQDSALSGYSRAVFSSICDGPCIGQEWAFERLGSFEDIRLMHIHGTSDAIIAYAATTEQLKEMFPADRYCHISVEGAGHGLTFDPRFSAQVVEALDSFFKM